MSKFSVFRKSAGIVLSMTMLFGMSACGKHVEAVITDDSEDITSYQEYPTVETSKADKFSYSDLTVNSLKYMMSENDVKNIYGTPCFIQRARFRYRLRCGRFPRPRAARPQLGP